MEAYAQVVDDMAALLSASVLQLLGGCRGAAAAREALQASGDCFGRVIMQHVFGAQEQQSLKCRPDVGSQP